MPNGGDVLRLRLREPGAKADAPNTSVCSPIESGPTWRRQPEGALGNLLVHGSFTRFFNSANVRPANRPSLTAVESSGGVVGTASFECAESSLFSCPQAS